MNDFALFFSLVPEKGLRLAKTNPSTGALPRHLRLDETISSCHETLAHILDTLLGNSRTPRCGEGAIDHGTTASVHEPEQQRRPTEMQHGRRYSGC